MSRINKTVFNHPRKINILGTTLEVNSLLQITSLPVERLTQSRYLPELVLEVITISEIDTMGKSQNQYSRSSRRNRKKKDKYQPKVKELLKKKKQADIKY